MIASTLGLTSFLMGCSPVFAKSLPQLPGSAIT